MRLSFIFCHVHTIHDLMIKYAFIQVSHLFVFIFIIIICSSVWARRKYLLSLSWVC